MNAAADPPTTDVPHLTPREGEVLRLMAAGLTNEGIAVELEFGVDAAKIHARHIYAKFAAENRTDAVAMGFTTGLLDIADIKALRATLKAPLLPLVEPKIDAEVE